MFIALAKEVLYLLLRVFIIRCFWACQTIHHRKSYSLWWICNCDFEGVFLRPIPPIPILTPIPPMLRIKHILWPSLSLRWKESWCCFVTDVGCTSVFSSAWMPSVMFWGSFQHGIRCKYSWMTWRIRWVEGIGCLIE